MDLHLSTNCRRSANGEKENKPGDMSDMENDSIQQYDSVTVVILGRTSLVQRPFNFVIS